MAKELAPWEPLPPEVQGDSPDDIHLRVGRALTEWEMLQDAMTKLFCAVVGFDGRSLERAFGATDNVRAKMKMIEHAAKITFAEKPETRNKITKLAARVEQFNRRRNDIAHGIALSIMRPGMKGGKLDASEARGTFLVPRYHDSEKRHTKVGEWGFRWTAKQIDVYRERFLDLRRDAISLLVEITEKPPEA